MTAPYLGLHYGKGEQRNSIPQTESDVKATCHKAFVCPPPLPHQLDQLEYASSIWDPHTQSNINKMDW